MTPVADAWFVPLAIGLAVVGLLFIVFLRTEKQRQQGELGSLELRLEAAGQASERLSQQNVALQVELSAAKERLVHMDRLEEELFQREDELQQLRHQCSTVQAELRERDTRLELERRSHEEKLAALEQARQQLQLEFKHLAQRIFDDSSQKFGTQQQEQLQGVLTPLREQLGEFRRRVDDVYDREAKDRRGLHTQIEQLKQLNLQMSQDALNLTNALKSETKTQGSWGELVLERVLEKSGLRRGYEYELQVHSRDEQGRRFQPDVIIRLPQDKDIIVDAKVSLRAYERYCSADTSTEREQALNQHLLSVRRHIKSLSEKGYEQLPQLRSLDFVLLFVPIEAAFLAAVEADSELFSSAFERNILLVSPSTLLVTLRTIDNIWRYEKQNLNALEIARRGADLHDKFVGFVASLDDVGRHLQQAQNAYQSAHKQLSSGKGNLVKRVAELKSLGVRGKKQLSKALVARARELPDGDAAYSLPKEVPAAVDQEATPDLQGRSKSDY